MRAIDIDDGLATRPGPFQEHHSTMAARRDVADSERFAGGQMTSAVTTRFVVAWTQRNAAIMASDLLRVGPVQTGQHYEIVGVKVFGLRAGIEISAHTRDAP